MRILIGVIPCFMPAAKHRGWRLAVKVGPAAHHESTAAALPTTPGEHRTFNIETLNIQCLPKCRPLDVGRWIFASGSGSTREKFRRNLSPLRREGNPYRGAFVPLRI